MDDAWKQRPLHAKSVPGVLTAEECDAIKNDALAVGMSRALVRTPKGKRKLRRSDLRSRAAAAHQGQRVALRALDGDQRSDQCRILALCLEQHRGGSGAALQADATLRLAFRYGARAGPQTHLRGQFVASPIPLAGGLEVRGEHHGKSKARQQGAATIFPTYLRHRASSPWVGQRWSLVTWLSGPAWV